MRRCPTPRYLTPHCSPNPITRIGGLAAQRTILPLMKRTKQCPKCDSRRVGFGVEGPNTSASLYITESVAVASERWLCTDCGYVEWYVRDPAALRSAGDFQLANPEPPHDTPYR